MKKSGKVLIAAPVHSVLSDGLQARGYECISSEHISQKTAHTLMADCVGVITSTRLQLDKELIDAAPGLQWIGRMGSGMEVVDMVYAAEKGIKCFSSPEGNCNAVAEHAVGMLLSLVRRIGLSNEEVKQGVWQREENRGTELEGKIIGIIGYGHTGRAFAKKLMGFDMRIMAYDKYDAKDAPEHITNCESLEPVFREADIVSFHVPLQQDTIHYFNEEFIEQMRKPFILINTSRGAVVDTVALRDGLEAGKIAGACLDVFEQEPLPVQGAPLSAIFNDIIARPNVIATPHIAGYTFEAVYKMSKVLLEKIISGI